MAYYGSFTATSQGSRLDHSVDKGPGTKENILWLKWVCAIGSRESGKFWGIAPLICPPTRCPGLWV